MAPQLFCCDATQLLGHLWFCDIIETDHRLYCQPHSQFEAEHKGCHLIFVAQFRRTIFELFKDILLCLRQGLNQIILITGEQIQNMRICTASNDIPIRWVNVAVI